MDPYKFICNIARKHQPLLDDSYSKEIYHRSLLIPYYNHKGELIQPTNTLNGSICKYKDKILFAYRLEQKKWFTNTRIAICELDKDFNVYPGTARLLNLHDDSKGNHSEDGRMFVCNGTLCISYCDGYKMAMGVFDDELNIIHSGYFPDFSFNQDGGDGREKNWTPFEYRTEPHFIYSDSPRVIIKHDHQKNYIPRQDIQWDYGIIRGGTPAIAWDDSQFITFFHSAKRFKGGPGWPRLYFSGAYLFERKPPFRVTAISSVPLLRGFPPHNEVPRPAREVLVVFPSGIIDDDGKGYWISYGKNDCSNYVVYASRKLLELHFKYV